MINTPGRFGNGGNGDDGKEKPLPTEKSTKTRKKSKNIFSKEDKVVAESIVGFAVLGIIFYLISAVSENPLTFLGATTAGTAVSYYGLKTYINRRNEQRGEELLSDNPPRKKLLASVSLVLGAIIGLITSAVKYHNTPDAPPKVPEHSESTPEQKKAANIRVVTDAEIALMNQRMKSSNTANFTAQVEPKLSERQETVDQGAKTALEHAEKSDTERGAA